MTKAERELLFTLARLVLSRLGDVEPGATTDEEAATLTASLAALEGTAEETRATDEPAAEAYSANAEGAAIARALAKKSANGKAVPQDGRERWANGELVSNEDKGLGK